jgi:hypothetical protein
MKRCHCPKIKIVVTFVFRECAACFNLGLNPESLSNFRKQVWILIFLLENTLKGIFYRYRTGMYIAFKAHTGGHRLRRKNTAYVRKGNNFSTSNRIEPCKCCNCIIIIPENHRIQSWNPEKNIVNGEPPVNLNLSQSQLQR